MRHGYFGRGLSRNTNERRRLLMVLARELIAHGQIKTSRAKAKAVQPMVEKLVTKAKKGTASSKRQLFKVLADEGSVKLLLSWAPTRFAGRNSGFTRMIKLASRSGDGIEEVLFSFVDPPPAATIAPVEKKKLKEVAKTAKPKVAKAKKTVKKSPIKKKKTK